MVKIMVEAYIETVYGEYEHGNSIRFPVEAETMPDALEKASQIGAEKTAECYAFDDEEKQEVVRDLLKQGSYEFFDTAIKNFTVNPIEPTVLEIDWENRTVTCLSSGSNLDEYYVEVVDSKAAKNDRVILSTLDLPKED